MISDIPNVPIVGVKGSTVQVSALNDIGDGNGVKGLFRQQIGEGLRMSRRLRITRLSVARPMLENSSFFRQKFNKVEESV